MLQVASFLLPSEQDKANEFLRTHKPAGNINFNKDTIIVFYDDGTISPEYEIADFQELLESNRKARVQQEIALHVMKAELADLNPTHNKGRYEEVSYQIRQVEDAISTQDIKAEFVRTRIAQLRGGCVLGE
jgi:hypothetical protein